MSDGPPAGEAPLESTEVGLVPAGDGDENVTGGAYVVDAVAARHGVGVDEETSDPDVAYARFPKPRPTRYRDGWLPFGS